MTREEILKEYPFLENMTRNHYKQFMTSLIVALIEMTLKDDSKTKEDMKISKMLEAVRFMHEHS